MATVRQRLALVLNDTVEKKIKNSEWRNAEKLIQTEQNS